MGATHHAGLALTLALLAGSPWTATRTSAIEPIERRLPPPGHPIPEAESRALESRAASLRERFGAIADSPHAADAEVYLEAVELALELGEFYELPADLEKAHRALSTAESRIESLAEDRANDADPPPWAARSIRGRVVLGYRSSIDRSPEPYGLEIPAALDLESDPVPLYVWLHGRGDTNTDLHFIHDRETKDGQFHGRLDDGITLHPFGRHCIGFKSAGEIDVLEAIAEVQRRYPVDPDRVVLMGFSMGGAGAWHLGAHYTERFAAVHAGAGFVDVARYQRLKPESFPPEWEQTLWGLYDVPTYARNLLNLPVIAYSGSEDRQKDAADFMAETLAEHGFALPHVVGQGMGHKYDDAGLDAVVAFLRRAVRAGRNPLPDSIHLQTRTLRYPRLHWIEINGLERHWSDSRIDARLDPHARRLDIATTNVTAFRIRRDLPDGTEVVVDGSIVHTAATPRTKVLHLARSRNGAEWQVAEPTADATTELRKRPGLQGPIDDAFLSPFLVVAPAGEGIDPAVDAWVRFELDHLRARWRALFRGTLPERRPEELTAEDTRTHHLIVFGDPVSQPVLARVIGRLPLKWDAKEGLELAGTGRHSAASHVPVLVYPNPENPDRYLVVNSGPTFREAHDRTNSLQNPKLPDWAILDIASRPPDGEAAGHVKRAGFFDEAWNAPASVRPLEKGKGEDAEK